MMKKLILLVIVTLCLVGAGETFAQGRNRGSRFDDRQHSQRLRRAVRSGRISREDARLLYLRRQRSDSNRRFSYYRNRNDHRRGNGYYRRGAGSESHPVFGRRNRIRNRYYDN